MRVTLGGGEIDQFQPMGYDQWFRIFQPLGGDEGLERLPAKANKLFGYLKYLRIPDGVRPVMRNYSVRAFRPATADTGAELDVDFVLHGSAADRAAELGIGSILLTMTHSDASAVAFVVALGVGSSEPV